MIILETSQDIYKNKMLLSRQSFVCLQTPIGVNPAFSTTSTSGDDCGHGLN